MNYVRECEAWQGCSMSGWDAEERTNFVLSNASQVSQMTIETKSINGVVAAKLRLILVAIFFEFWKNNDTGLKTLLFLFIFKTNIWENLFERTSRLSRLPVESEQFSLLHWYHLIY